MHYFVCAAEVYIEVIGLRTIWWRNDSGENELGIRGTQMGPFFVWALIKALFVKIVVFKTKLFKVDLSGSARLLREQRDR